MGVLTDFIVAPSADARELLNADPRDPRWRRSDRKGMDSVKLGTLEAAILGQPYDNTIINRCPELASGGEDGPWVFEIDPQLIKALAGIHPDRRADIAAKWARSEELEGWSPEEVVELLKGVIDDAQAAERAGKPLLMWLCL